MRYLIGSVLTCLLLAGPVVAQPSAQDKKPAESTQKPAATNNGTPATGQAAATTPAPAQQPAKDQTMGDYDVTGSSASDAMGSAPP